MTLRLLHHPSPIPSLRLRAIRSGGIAYFGPEVEARATRTLADICERVGRETRDGLAKVGRLQLQQMDLRRGRERPLHGHWEDPAGGASSTEESAADAETAPVRNEPVHAGDSAVSGWLGNGDDDHHGHDSEPEAVVQRQGALGRAPGTAAALVVPPTGTATVDPYTLQQLEALWIEQGAVARTVLERIRQGDTDW